MPKRIAVYGSLKQGFGNSHHLDGYEPVSKEVIDVPFRMVSLGGFPGLLPMDTNSPITFEVYEVEDAAYKSIERLEGYPSFYQKAVIPTSVGEAEIYILEDPRYQEKPTHESGCW